MKELIWTRAHFDLEVVDGALVVVFFSLAQSFVVFCRRSLVSDCSSLQLNPSGDSLLRNCHPSGFSLLTQAPPCSGVRGQGKSTPNLRPTTTPHPPPTAPPPPQRNRATSDPPRVSISINRCVSGLVVKSIVAIDGPRVRFAANATMPPSSSMDASPPAWLSGRACH